MVNLILVRLTLGNTVLPKDLILKALRDVAHGGGVADLTDDLRVGRQHIARGKSRIRYQGRGSSSVVLAGEPEYESQHGHPNKRASGREAGHGQGSSGFSRSSVGQR